MDMDHHPGPFIELRRCKGMLKVSNGQSTMPPVTRVLIAIAVVAFVGSFAWAISIDEKHLPVKCPRVRIACDPTEDEATDPQNGARLAIVAGGLTITVLTGLMAEKSMRE